MKLRKELGFLVLALGVAGCGGGSSGSGGTVPTGADFAFGELSGRAAISNPPVSTSSQYVIGTALTGTFNTLKLRELNPGIQETRIFGCSDLFGSGIGLVSYAIDGSDAQKITPPGAIDEHPSASGNGKIVLERVFGGPVAAQSGGPVGKSALKPLFTPAIWIVNMDGTSPTQMAPAGFKPSFDYAGDKFSFIPDATHINVENVSTKATTDIPLPTNDGIYADVLSPDGSTVYAVLSLSGTYTLYSLPANGSGGSGLNKNLGTSQVTDMAISADGTELAMIQSGSPAHILRFGVGGGEAAPSIALPSADGNGLSYSADGKSLAVGTDDGVAAIGLYVVNLQSSSMNRITSTTTGTSMPAWSPFIKDRVLIAAAGGLLGTRACGVIQAQHILGGTACVIAFDVTTPSSVVMTAQPSSITSQTNLVFSVDADNIVKLAYANATAWRGIRAIGSGTPVTSANGALVSIDGFTGSISTILPFLGTRAAGSRPTVKDEGSVKIFTGQFLAAYDKDGKNLAPNGATTVRLDTKTNKLTVG